MNLKQAVEHGFLILDEVPDGWVKLDGALTQPRGYEWYSNNKSRFSGERKSALVKLREVTECR